MSLLSKWTGIHIGGAAIGSIIGSVIPGVGTALGGFLGGAFDTASSLPAPKPQLTSGGSVPNTPGIDWSHPFNPGADPFGLGTSTPAGRPVNGRCAPGWHPNRHPLAACKSHGAVGPGQVCVRNRHMNPANGRSIGRAVRRIKAGEKQYRKVFTILHHKPAGKFLPKTRKK